MFVLWILAKYICKSMICLVKFQLGSEMNPLGIPYVSNEIFRKYHLIPGLTKTWRVFDAV